MRGRWSELLVATIAMVMAVLGACTEKPDSVASFQKLPDNGWPYGNVVDIPIAADTTGRGRLSVALRHTDDYEFRNLWLEVRYMLADSTEVTDTLNIELADVYGHWRSQGVGGYYQIEVPVATDVNLPKDSHVYIRHVMRADTLHGVSHAGVSFVR